ncbi:hypothetical protein Fmac_008679 [Flemingia macrophylla]|uniref:Uncharacterized protein n=1 Tax=Flemingia macrophylla TaxID=520843 RepID=A0ABD1MY64_9FABA
MSSLVPRLVLRLAASRRPRIEGEMDGCDEFVFAEHASKGCEKEMGRDAFLNWVKDNCTHFPSFKVVLELDVSSSKEIWGNDFRSDDGDALDEKSRLGFPLSL